MKIRNSMFGIRETACGEQLTITFYFYMFFRISPNPFMSFCRYRAIKHPLEYSQAQTSGNHKPIIFTILLVWIIAAAVGLPILFGLNDRYREI